ncbi:MAG: phosphate ABC transporter permease PstA [Bacillota bacterium]|nr:phosphate ABC transporter permease PstA [Bacillota bacterium]
MSRPLALEEATAGRTPHPRPLPPPDTAWRRWKDRLMIGLTVVAFLLAVVPLVHILGYTFWQGLPAINWAFFTQLPAPVGEPGGGIAQALVGTLVIVLMAAAMGVPVGLLAGIYLAEFGRGRFAAWVSFLSDVLTGVPSITVGIFAYTLIVVPMRSFSAFSGAVALAILMIPTVTRTTVDMLRLVPVEMRDGALALGAPWWYAVVAVEMRQALPGIVTGVMLAVARVAGETAPLLFTAFGSDVMVWNVFQPMASMTLQIFKYSISPFAQQQRLAWGAALVLIALVLVLNLGARALARRMSRYNAGRR